MNSFDWKGFLQRWSTEILTYTKDNNYMLPTDEFLPGEVVASRWLGYSPATDEQIQKAETRLGAMLPPSYRAFLKASNGWRQLTPFIWHVWPVEEIDWYKVRHQEVIDVLTRSTQELGRPIEDEEYFVYGEGQNIDTGWRVEYLATALEVSEETDGNVYLLNPQVVTPEGEWEAWFFAPGWFGARRYRSFLELMRGEHERFLRSPRIKP